LLGDRNAGQVLDLVPGSQARQDQQAAGVVEGARCQHEDRNWGLRCGLAAMAAVTDAAEAAEVPAMAGG
jgi:hypothetical protein